MDQKLREWVDRVRGLPLEEVLLLTGARQDRYDKAKWHTPRGTISVTGSKFMNWRLQAGGGGAIDLAIHLYGFPFTAAVHWLWQHFPEAPPQPRAAPSRRRPPLILPQRDSSRLSRVEGYLVRERGLPSTRIQPLLESGTLYADSRGNAVFLLLGKDNHPVGAELRGSGARPWRGLAPGSSKDLGYFSVPLECAASIILCESAIDALSCSELHPRCLCLSTSGARANPRWLPALSRKGYEIYCGFDADKVGDQMAAEMIALHPAILRMRPVLHDWNDVLRARS